MPHSSNSFACSSTPRCAAAACCSRLCSAAQSKLNGGTCRVRRTTVLRSTRWMERGAESCGALRCVRATAVCAALGADLERDIALYSCRRCHLHTVCKAAHAAAAVCLGLHAPSPYCAQSILP